jgi:hypothetical protein
MMYLISRFVGMLVGATCGLPTQSPDCSQPRSVEEGHI